MGLVRVGLARWLKELSLLHVSLSQTRRGMCVQRSLSPLQIWLQAPRPLWSSSAFHEENSPADHEKRMLPWTS